jgi:hypothetical protein
MADNTQKPLISSSADDGESLLGSLSEFMRQHDFRFECLLPAAIDNFDRATNQATVQPLINLVTVEGKQQPRHLLASIPVLSMGGGGFHISFPLKKGDLGWIVASDRDISLFKQALQMSAPNTKRAHKFEDAWFIPDVFRKYTINSADSAAMVIQSTDGVSRISISGSHIDITTTDHFNVTATGTVNVTAPTVNVVGNVNITGDLTVSGVTKTGGGLNLNTHVHGGVLSGSSNSSGPHN